MGNPTRSSARIEGNSEIASWWRWSIRFAHPSYRTPIVLTYLCAAGATLTANENAHKNWCDDLATKLLCVFALDRFGDYVSDQVSALPSGFSPRLTFGAVTGCSAGTRNRSSSTRDSSPPNATIVRQLRPTNSHRHGRTRWSAAVSWSRWSSSR